MSQAENPARLEKSLAGAVTVEDVRELFGACTPHFALQLRNRIARLVEGLPDGHPARVEGEREIARLESIAYTGQARGEADATGERPMPSVSLA